jgi:asparagine synthetase B (glutamine-hydrolysing)
MKINRARDVLSNNNFSISEIALSPFSGTPLFRDLARKYFKSHQFECTEEYYSGKILPRVYLTKSDRMSMANSVEVRSPFLDLEVIREGMKFSKVELSYRSRKWILKELAKRHLPDYLLKNQKHGFSPPLGSILKHVIEPNWSLEIRNLAQVSPSHIWRNAREDQNYAIAAWALMVLDHFIRQGNLALLEISDN